MEPQLDEPARGGKEDEPDPLDGLLSRSKSMSSWKRVKSVEDSAVKEASIEIQPKAAEKEQQCPTVANAKETTVKAKEAVVKAREPSVEKLSFPEKKHAVSSIKRPAVTPEKAKKDCHNSFEAALADVAKAGKRKRSNSTKEESNVTVKEKIKTDAKPKKVKKEKKEDSRPKDKNDQEKKKAKEQKKKRKGPDDKKKDKVKALEKPLRAEAPLLKTSKKRKIVAKEVWDVRSNSSNSSGKKPKLSRASSKDGSLEDEVFASLREAVEPSSAGTSFEAGEVQMVVANKEDQVETKEVSKSKPVSFTSAIGRILKAKKKSSVAAQEEEKEKHKESSKDACTEDSPQKHAGKK